MIFYEVQGTHQPDDMTVSDLKELLSKFPDDMKVCIPRDEGGYDNLHGSRIFNLLKNVNTEHYYGKHDHISSVCDPNEYESEQMLVLLR